MSITLISEANKTSINTQAVSGSALVDSETNIATVNIKVPGVFDNGNGRFFLHGEVFFDTQSATDKMTAISVVDIDNILGHGANFIVTSFYEKNTMSASNQGWFIPMSRGFIETKIGRYAFIPAELYLQILGYKALELNQSATMFVNIAWSLS